MSISKHRKRRIITALVVVEILICFAIMSIVWSGIARPQFRFFYLADTQAEETIHERFLVDDRAMTLDLTNVRGQVLLALWDSFKEHGIGIPFPHREILMRTPVEVQIKNGPKD